MSATKTELTPEVLLAAYARGFFPMAPARDSKELRWYEPEVRGILPLETFHVPRSLQRVMRLRSYRVTFDSLFEEVIRHCADVRAETWINDQIIALYTELYHQGHAHSVEVIEDGKLTGGLYGIAMGGAFFGESMFSLKSGASKIALVHLAARLKENGFLLLDAQFPNAHLKQFGLEEIPKAEYRQRLAKALQSPVPGAGASSSSSVFSSSFAGGAGVSGAAAGVSSAENSCGFEAVAAFLQSITHTS